MYLDIQNRLREQLHPGQGVSALHSLSLDPDQEPTAYLPFLGFSFRDYDSPLDSSHAYRAPFAGASQRIYMSATLGGESDLRRAYCIQKLQVVRAKSQ